ncbi:MAG TPA: hypothetical protein VKP69_25565 [Isosphaeraceae bacterium]|nr:hypothetical protein [Isosphaeraceae bacterium]
MAEEWKAIARDELRGLQVGATGWAYRRGAPPGVEPTALVCLGLLAARPGAPADAELSAARAGADWLAAIQQPDGSLGLSGRQPEPGWTTPYGILLWRALGDYETRRRRAVEWLLRQKGKAYPWSDPERIAGHNTMLVGWPWVAETHSWLEPTAMAILALRREGCEDHPRVLEGLGLIHDRAIPSGGWNCGNKAVFGRTLRPQLGPTGLALLVLARRGQRSAVVERAIAYLNATLPGVRAPASLGWGLLGLRAWGRAPDDAGHWLAEAFARSSGRPDAAPRLAHLLLAAGEAALGLLIGGAPSGA